MVYYLHVLRAPLKRLLLMIGITVSWATLVRPARAVSGGVHETTTKAFAAACLVLFAALIHSLGVKNLTSRLHSSTFWEQLHTTVRQENILKKLAGPPIRPRPRPAKSSQGKAWKLVRGALRQRRRDQERQKKKDGSDNLIHERVGGGVTTVTTVTNGGVRRGASEGSLASLAQRATHRRDRSLDSDGGLSDDSPFDTVRSDASDNPPNASHSQRPSLAHVQFTDGAEGAAGACAGGEGVDLAPVAEGAECNGRNAHGHHHNHDQSSQSSDNEREGSLSDGSFDTATWNEPSGAKAAESLGSAEVGTLGAGEVSIAVVNAAARHVRKGVFSLPFRKTTRAMQKLRPKRMDSAAKPGSPVSTFNYLMF